MYQEWNMFSPKVIMHEKWVISDIAFENGEKLKLFTNDDNIEKKFNYKYFHPYNNQFWRKLFGRLSKSSYSKYIPRFKQWLIKTDYFSEYKGRKVADVKIWKLSERSTDIKNWGKVSRKVRKNELKKTNKKGKGIKNKISKKNLNKKPMVKSRSK
jgi:hypothetical protein